MLKSFIFQERDLSASRSGFRTCVLPSSDSDGIFSTETHRFVIQNKNDNQTPQDIQ